MTRQLERGPHRALALAAVLLALCQTGQTQEAQGASLSAASGGTATLFQGVRVFDGKVGSLSGATNVLVRGNRIGRTSADPIPTDRGAATAAMIVDGPVEVRVRVREQLMLGASQIKLTAGGGVASPHSPLDVSTFFDAEPRAAVEAAENWGTYVTVHAYTPVSIRRAIAAGVKCIEHGHLMDDSTAKLIAEEGIWLSTRAFPDELAHAFPPGSLEHAKAMEVFVGTDATRTLAKRYRIKTAWDTDVLYSPGLAQRQGELLSKLVRWYTPAETLVMATGNNVQLLALSGKHNPYPGKLGVVEEGAFADLLLVDGDPIADNALLDDRGKNLLVIMKDGTIYKNTVGNGDPLPRWVGLNAAIGHMA